MKAEVEQLAATRREGFKGIDTLETAKRAVIQGMVEAAVAGRLKR
jgi:hypothetical protein